MKNPISPSPTAGVRMESLEIRRLCALSFQFDYRFDSSGFFSSQARKDTLVAAGKALLSRVTDTFDAVSPSGGNSWSISLTTPGGGTSASIPNPTVSANTILVFVGARDLPGGTLGQGGPTGWGASGTSDWINAVRGRGESGAVATPRTDFAPKAGAISFDAPTNFFFSPTLSGIGSGQTDFFSVATHELGHVLGIGAGSETWPGYVSGGAFNGPKTKALYGKAVPLAPDGSHFAEGVTYGGQEASMDPTIKTGIRKTFTALDYAALDDIGYDLTAVAPTGKITGNVFNDLNGDGSKSAGETGLGGWQAYLDKNKDGKFNPGETTANTDGSGNYTFTVSPGSYRVAVVQKTGYRRTSPAAGNYDTVVTANGTSGGKNFGYTQKALVSGQVFKDANGNGTKSGTGAEPGLSGFRVFLDKNNDGNYSTSETSVLTDGDGNFGFKTLSAGSYVVRVVARSGYTLKAPTGKSFTFTLTSGGSKTGLLFAEKPA